MTETQPEADVKRQFQTRQLITGMIILLLVVAVGYVALLSNNEDIEQVSNISNHDNNEFPIAVANGDVFDEGKALYQQHCASCHGIDGEGQNPPIHRDDDGRYMAPPHDSTGHTWHHDDMLLFTIVAEGGMGDLKYFYEMPAFADRLGDEEIHAVLAYIKTMWTTVQQSGQIENTRRVQAQSDE